MMRCLVQLVQGADRPTSEWMIRESVERAGSHDSWRRCFEGYMRYPDAQPI